MICYSPPPPALPHTHAHARTRLEILCYFLNIKKVFVSQSHKSYILESFGLSWVLNRNTLTTDPKQGHPQCLHIFVATKI